MEYYNNLEDFSEFIHNIHVMLSEEYVDIKNIGYLCYLPEGYKKHIQKENKKEAEKTKSVKSDYFGEIGKRYKDKFVKSIKMVNSFETVYGIMYIYKIILEDFSILIWKTNKSLYNVDVGKITFTVKDHKEYKSEKQTEVTRCKIN